jgi:hypothetical protein
MEIFARSTASPSSRWDQIMPRASIYVSQQQLTQVPLAAHVSTSRPEQRFDPGTQVPVHVGSEQTNGHAVSVCQVPAASHT